MEGESGEEVGDKLETVTSSAESLMQGCRGWTRQEIDSKDVVMHSEMSD